MEEHETTTRETRPAAPAGRRGGAASAPVPRLAAVAAFAALAAGLLYLGRDMTLPIILGDEFGYLANAAYFTGHDWAKVLAGFNYYSFGYSLPLVPLFLLFEDPYAIYQGALTLNALAVAAAHFPALYVAGRLMPSADWRTRLGGALLACLYPSVIAYSVLAWAESFFVLVFWLLAALFCRLQDTEAPGWVAGLAALTAVYLYAVHPRGLTVLAAAVLVMAMAVASRAWPWRRALWFLAVLAPAFALAEWTRLELAANAWGGVVMENSYATVGERVGVVASFAGLRRLFVETIGQGYYLGTATYGFAAVGLVVVARLAWRRYRGGAGRPASLAERLRHGVRWDAGFVLLAVVLTFMLSVGFQLRAARGDQWIFGRYNEGVIGPLLLVGVVALCARGRGWWWRAGLAVGSIVLVFGLAEAVGLQEIFAAAVRPVHANVTGVFPYRDAVWQLNFVVVSVNVLVTSIVLLAALRLHRGVGIALTAAVFVWAGVNNVESQFSFVAEMRSEAVSIRAWVEENVPDDGTIQYLMDGAEDSCLTYRWIYQFLLPEHRIQPVYTVSTAAPGDPTLVISCSDLRTTLPAARPLAAETKPRLTLWQVDAGAAEPAPSAVPAGLPGPTLPAAAYRAELSSDGLPASLTIDRGSTAVVKWLTTPRILRGLRRWKNRLEVEVGNPTAYDWPSTVNLGIVWIDRHGNWVAEHRADFGEPLAAGERETVVVPLVPIGRGGRLLPAGRYTVRIGPVHEGIAWFFHRGDEPLDLLVTLD